MNSCSEAMRLMNSAKHCGGFVVIAAASSVAGTMIGVGLGMTFCTFWDDRQKGAHAIQRMMYVEQLEQMTQPTATQPTATQESVDPYREKTPAIKKRP